MNLGPRLLTLPLLILLAVSTALCDESVIAKAMTALHSGDLASAEAILEAEVKSNPADAPAFEILAVVLDQQHKYTDAAAVYEKALRLAPHSASLHNNYGNHLLQMGDPKAARTEFLKVLAETPRQPNATIQLARVALELKQPAEADRYLSQLTPDLLKRPDVSILRMQTSYLLHRTVDADNLLGDLSVLASNATDLFRLAVALASVGQYSQAENFFSKVVELQPANTEALRDLGLAASHAGHDARARDALKQVLDKQPDNVDVLYDLSAVDARLNEKETALALLVRAHQLAPKRADVQFLLAHTAEDLGYFSDAVNAWQTYSALAPDDDAAKRECAFAETAIGQNTTEALKDLQAYVHRHPSDPVGHYELGTATISSDRQGASNELTRALALKPDLPAAHLARGLIYTRDGHLEAALKDFTVAAGQNPQNAVILDHLGETYLNLNRTGEAVRTLRRAQQLAPDDTTLLLHLGRALTKAGDGDAAAAVLAHYRELGGPRAGRPHPAGLVDFLSLSPEEQQKRYRAGVLRTLQNDPTNADAEVRYLELLLDDGKSDDAKALCQKLAGQGPDNEHLERAASDLLDARLYSTALELLTQAPSESPGLMLDHAIAVLYVRGPAAALTELDRIPPASRNVDYHLARAESLLAANRIPDALTEMGQAGSAASGRPGLYRDTALLLLSKDEIPAARPLLDQALKRSPGDPEIEVLNALAVSLATRSSHNPFRDLELRWPDWPALWLAEAAVSEVDGDGEAATRCLSQAAALVPGDPLLAALKKALSLPSTDPSKRHAMLSLLPALFGVPVAPL